MEHTIIKYIYCHNLTKQTKVLIILFKHKRVKIANGTLTDIKENYI